MDTCGLIQRLLEHFLDTTLLADRRTEGVELSLGHLSNFPKKETNGEKMHLFLLQDSQMSVPLWEVYNRHWWPRWWFQIQTIFILFPSFGEDEPNLTSIFFKWGVQPPTLVTWYNESKVVTVTRSFGDDWICGDVRSRDGYPNEYFLRSMISMWSPKKGG